MFKELFTYMCVCAMHITYYLRLLFEGGVYITLAELPIAQLLFEANDYNQGWCLFE